MKNLVSKASVESYCKDLGKAFTEDEEHIYGQLYGTDGNIKNATCEEGGLVWRVPRSVLEELEVASDFLHIESISILRDDAGIFFDSSKNAGRAAGFWFAIVTLRDRVVPVRPLLHLVSVRGTQGHTEMLADVGLFQDEIISQVSWKFRRLVLPYMKSKLKTLAKTEGLDKALDKLGALNLSSSQFNFLTEVVDKSGVKLKSGTTLDEFFDIDGVASEAANSLVRHVQELAKTLSDWSNGSRIAFGSQLVGSLQPALEPPVFLTLGHSLGGWSATLVALHLRHDHHKVVASITVNAPGVRNNFPSNLRKHRAAGFAAGFVSLVTQHDVFWKVGGHLGQKVCMYLHPAEDFACRTGDVTFSRWTQLSDAVHIGCADGLSDAGKADSWASRFTITLGSGVLHSRWKCEELLTSGCLMNEHGFKFPAEDHPFTNAKPVVGKLLSVTKLESWTGITLYSSSLDTYTDRVLRGERLQAAEAAIRAWAASTLIDLNKSLQERFGNDVCMTDMTAQHCCSFDKNGKCKHRTRHDAEGDWADFFGIVRQPCLEASTPVRCVSNTGFFKSCECATGYCYLLGEGCVSGPAREREKHEVEVEKRLRQVRRQHPEGTLDPNLNGHWACTT